MKIKELKRQVRNVEKGNLDKIWGEKQYGLKVEEYK